MKRIFGMFVFGLAAFLVPVTAQTTSVITSGLNLPTKVIAAPHNTLLVSEDGTAEPNSGRISVVSRITGERRTLISGLPSGVDNLGGQPDPDGTTGIFLDGCFLYITSGVGDATTNTGGVEYPTGAPSSPIFDSVLEVILPNKFESLDSEFKLTLQDQNRLASGRWVRIRNDQHKSIYVRLVVDLPDYKPEPKPGFPDAIRSSHLFGVEKVGWDLFVVDASFNLMYKINLFTGRASTFAQFPNRPNPLFGTIGRPEIEAVPNNIHRLGDRLLVPELTGFPFVVGQSDVQSVSIWNGRKEPFIQGLSSAMDILPVEGPRHRMGYYTLEFSTNQLAGAPGRLQYFGPDGSNTTLVTGLATPSSMAYDDRTGDIFVTNIFPGTITRVHF